jgi:hypothetical protein
MMHSGRKVFTYPRGTYTPIISDGRRLYLTGYSSITALVPYRYKSAVASRVVAPKPKRKPKPPPKVKKKPKAKNHAAAKKQHDHRQRKKQG